MRSFSQFVFFAHRFRPSDEIIFHPAGHPFSSRFGADERSREHASARMRRAMPKSIVVQNAATGFRTALRPTGLQAAPLLGFREVDRKADCADAHFGYICV